MNFYWTVLPDRIFFVLRLLNSVAVVTKGASRLRVSRKAGKVGEGRGPSGEVFLDVTFHTSPVFGQQSRLEDNPHSAIIL